MNTYLTARLKKHGLLLLLQLGASPLKSPYANKNPYLKGFLTFQDSRKLNISAPLHEYDAINVCVWHFVQFNKKRICSKACRCLQTFTSVKLEMVHFKKLRQATKLMTRTIDWIQKTLLCRLACNEIMSPISAFSFHADSWGVKCLKFQRLRPITLRFLKDGQNNVLDLGKFGTQVE